MRTWLLTISLSALLVSPLMGQKVALVLSGGGAKGLAHVGVLKALEESEIPVDYVIGTSMGSVVGGLYASGYSPAEIEEIILSKNFQDIVYGRMSEDFNYYFTKMYDNASWITLNMSVDSIRGASLKTNLASDFSLNYNLAEYFARASQRSDYDFDSLMVPYRAVAADIFTQSQVVMEDGNLNDAIRASISVPFFYRPVRYKKKYLFDGGVYNNFPVDIAREEWDPDIIIGVNVSEKVFEDYPYENDEELISNSLLFMFLDKSEPGSVGKGGIYIEPNLEGYSAFDFPKAQSMIDSGYHATLSQLDELRKKIGRKQSCEEISKRRNQFVLGEEKLMIKEINVNGFNSNQERFLLRTFNSQGDELNEFDVKRAYFQLVSDDYFKNLYPRFLYDKEKEGYILDITGKPRNLLEFELGGNLSSRSISSLYLGAHYIHFNRLLNHHYAGIYTGRFYLSVRYYSRISIPTKTPIFIEPQFIYNNWDYLNANDIVFETRDRDLVKQIDRLGGLKFGIATGNKARVSLSVNGISNTDRYSNLEELTSTDTLDILKFRGMKYGVEYGMNSLNRKMYPTSGFSVSGRLNYLHGTEDYTPGSTSMIEEELREKHRWVNFTATAEQYFPMGKRFTFGYYGQLTVSNQQFFSNYVGTVINAPGFYPLMDSRTLILENFRAFNFVGGGIKNIYSFTRHLDLRLEAYLFKPFQEIVESETQEAGFTDSFSKVYFAANAGLVYNTRFGPVAANFNYYDDPTNKFGVLIHIGYVIFNPKSFE